MAQSDLAPIPFSQCTFLHNRVIRALLGWEINLKMLPLFVLQLKVLREHQVNIHWLASTVRNLINMSSGCLLTVSFNALPTHTPTHMNKVQAHTHTYAQLYTHYTWRIHMKHTHSCNSHKKKYSCTHARTHPYMLPSQHSRGSQQEGSADRLSQNTVSNSVTSVIISTTESELIGSPTGLLFSYTNQASYVNMQ